MIKAENVNYIYQQGMPFERQALYDVNIEIEDGSLVALIGHTGSGKSTLIQHFNALVKPTSGKIIINGIDVTAPKADLRLVRKTVGLVFQYPEHQLFESSVIRDVEFGPRNMGYSNLDVEMKAFQALKDVGIGDDLLDVSPLALSGGQKRRVAIAGVLAMEPEILVLDEPMAGLDPAGRKEIFELLLRLHKERQITIVFVSHSMEDVAQYADRVIVMNDGTIVLDGSPRKVFAYEEELRQIGLGVPQTTGLMHKLQLRGAKIAQEECITVEESVDAICQWINGEKRS